MSLFPCLPAKSCLLVRLIDLQIARIKYVALALLKGVIGRQASLVARWMGLGFIHGLMNTDNMSLSGETIDYGPCAFMDDYHPARKFSFIDEQGRYAYANQPGIAHWNLTRLAEALLPLLAENEEKALDLAQNALATFPKLFQTAWREVFAAKLGLTNLEEGIVEALLDEMAKQAVDFTLTFRRLTGVATGGDESEFLSLFPRPEPVRRWIGLWRERLDSSPLVVEHMRLANPVYIPRNHRIEEVIQAGRAGDFEPFLRLHRILSRPCEEQADSAAYEMPPRPHEVVRATFCGT